MKEDNSNEQRGTSHNRAIVVPEITIKHRIRKIVLFFKPWKLSVHRFIGTERANCDRMVLFISSPYIKPISYSNTLVDAKKHRNVGILIYKHK
jgi:hypothetical protein